MALYFVPLFITDALLNGGTEASSGMCQRILELAKNSRLGLRCYRRHGVRIERAIPAHVLEKNAAGKLENFVMKQLPRELLTLEKLREKVSKVS